MSRDNYLLTWATGIHKSEHSTSVCDFARQVFNFPCSPGSYRSHSGATGIYQPESAEGIGIISHNQTRGHPANPVYDKSPKENFRSIGLKNLMDSPSIGSSSRITMMLRSLSDGTADRNSKRIGTDSNEISGWLKIAALDGADSELTDEVQGKLKNEMLANLRELQKEFDSTAWMYSK